MNRIQHLETICDLNIRVEVFMETHKLSNETWARVNLVLHIISHLFDEIKDPQYTSVHFEETLADLIKMIDKITEEE